MYSDFVPTTIGTMQSCAMLLLTEKKIELNSDLDFYPNIYKVFIIIIYKGILIKDKLKKKKNFLKRTVQNDRIFQQ